MTLSSAKEALRSNKAEVRNPVLALPSAAKLQALDGESRAALRATLVDLRDDARARAAECWARHKAPMACYWKAVSVYANHLSRVLADAQPALRAQSEAGQP
jgi:hypothetical protein